MSDDPQIPPLATLDYFEDRPSAPFRLLARCVLIAGAVSALANLVDTAVFAPSEIAGALLFGNADLLEYLLAVVLLVQILVAIIVLVFSLIVLVSGFGSFTLLCGEAALIVLRAAAGALFVAKYARMTGANFPAHWMASEITQSISNIVESSLAPMLVIILLARKDRRDMATKKI